MIKEQQYLKVTNGNSAFAIRPTKQLKELGIVGGDRIFCFVEEIDGKQRIIIEKVE